MNKLRTKAKRVYESKTLSGSSQLTSGVDMKEGSILLASIVGAELSGSITEFKVVAFSDEALTADETVIATGDAFLTTTGDYASLEVSGAEVAQAGTDAEVEGLRYLSIRLNGEATDVVVVDFELATFVSENGLTADKIT